MLFDLRAKCPECQRTIHVEGGEAATFFYKRTCQGCRKVWAVDVKPAPTSIEGVFVHVLTWTAFDGGYDGRTP